MTLAETHPMDIVFLTADRYGDRHDLHHSINHMYQEWRTAMIQNRFIEDPLGPLPDDKEEELFDTFCRQLELMGMNLPTEDRDAILKEILED